MRTARNPLRTIALVLTAISLGACASTAAAPGTDVAAAQGESIFTIINERPTAITVFMEPAGQGERVNLGSVAAGATGSFTREVPRGGWRLAYVSETGVTRSSEINFVVPSNVIWDVRANRLTVNRR
jgi:hypothetical protein